jgi:hypothetical protein
MIKDKTRPIAVSIAAVLGAAVGAFWIPIVLAPQSAHFWNWGMRLISFATCPFIEIVVEYRRNIVWVPFLNAIVYGLLVYVILRFAKRPAIPVVSILGAASGVFWMSVHDAGVNGAHWPSYLPYWLEHTTFLFSFLMGQSGLANALVPFLNAFYWLLVYALLNVIYRCFRRWLSPKNKGGVQSGNGLAKAGL